MIAAETLILHVSVGTGDTIMGEGIAKYLALVTYTAEIREDGDSVYAWSRQWVLDTHGPAYPCHEAVLIRLERALPVDSPAYTFGHWSEDDLKHAWSAAYGLTRE